jgi:hypothetical protein
MALVAPPSSDHSTASAAKAKQHEQVKELVSTLGREKLEEKLLECSIQGFAVAEPKFKFEEPQMRKNGFGMLKERLLFERFKLPDPLDPEADHKMPPYLDQAAAWCLVEAKLCRHNQKPFIDPEQAELELQEAVVYNQISTKIRGDEELEHLKEVARREEEIISARRDLLANILGKIHGWRRPYQILPEPILFGYGNTLLQNEPRNAKKKRDPKAGRRKSVGVKFDLDRIPTMVKFQNTSIFYDVHFLVAVAMVTTKKSLFSKIFVSAEHADVGMYTFQFYQTFVDEMHTRGWQTVSVDNLIPVDGDLKAVLGELENPNECWLVYLEKAYAKFIGSYSKLHHGDVADVIEHLTGGETLLEEWSPEEISVEAMSRVWWNLNENYRHGLLSAACMLEDKPRPVKGSDTRHKYRQKEDYTEWNDSSVVVLATCEVPFKAAPGVEACTKKLIKMRNIYGNQTWFGDWSNDHRTWNKDNRRLTGYPQDAQDDCIFWMAIEDFVKNYNTVLTCQGFESAPEVFYRHLELQREGALPFYAHQYLLTVVDPFDPGFQNAQKRKEAEKQTKRTRPNLLHVKDMHKFEDEADEDIPEDSDDEDDWTREAAMKSLENQDKAMENITRDANMGQLNATMDGKESDVLSASRSSKVSSMSDFSDFTELAASMSDAKEARDQFSFKKLKQDISRGNAELVEIEEQEEKELGPKFTALIDVSQPPHFSHVATTALTVTDLIPMTVNLFQVRGPGLQPCSFEENSKIAGTTDAEEGDLSHYRFPVNNLVAMKEDKGDNQYQIRRSIVLKPGHYVLAVHQEQYWEHVHYCLKLTTEDDKSFPTNYVCKITELGSCGNPVKQADDEQAAAEAGKQEQIAMEAQVGYRA